MENLKITYIDPKPTLNDRKEIRFDMGDGIEIKADLIVNGSFFAGSNMAAEYFGWENSNDIIREKIGEVAHDGFPYSIYKNQVTNGKGPYYFVYKGVY